MAKPQAGVWGIDIGQCALKAVRVENIDGVVTATAFDYVEHPKILSQPDADPDQLTREALEKFLSRNSLRGDQVAMSVPGQSGLARFVKLPPVEEKKINEIVHFEAKQQIPFALEEVVWDYQRIGSGVVTDGFAMETEIGLFAIKREAVQRALQHFQEVDVEVNLVQMAPLALCNFVSYDLLNKDAGVNEEDEGGKKHCVVALDIGVESSNMVITDGERVIWQRPIPIGGNRFTRALTREMKLTFAKAEHLKKNATKSPDLRKILAALKPDLNEFVNEVQKSLTFFTNSHRDAQVQYLIGLGSAFRLPGLQKFLNERLQLEVRKLQKFNRLAGDSVITAPVFNDNVLSFGVAYGLAVQGLKLARLQTNLLPGEIRLERQIRGKKPWAVAAAAALLLGVAGLAFGYRLEYDAVASPEIELAKQQGVAALANADKWKKDCDAKEAQVKALHRQVRTIIAGQDERLNWVKLHRYINECLPRTDGKTIDGKDLPSDAKAREYWDRQGGQAAWEKYKAKQSSGRVDEEDDLRALMQINLMNVNALWTDDLGGYFSKLKEDGKDLTGMLAADRARPPTGAGWVVELRGFTYHDAGEKFILDTLVDNLTTRHKDRKAPAKEAPKEEKPAEGQSAALPPPAVDPIGGHISHVVMSRFQQVEKPEAGVFPLIKDSYVARLVGAPVMDPGAAPGARPAGGKRDGWRPLGGAEANVLKGGGRAAGEIPERKKDPDKKDAEPNRFEFVILFVWQEPTPSDSDKGFNPTTPGGKTTRQPKQ